MKIAVDLDMVMGDFLKSFIKFHNHTYNTPIVNRDSYHLWEILGDTKERAYSKLEEFYHSKFFDEMPTITGSVAGVEILSSRYPITIITSRPEYTKGKTLQWLDRHYTRFFKDIHFSTYPVNGTNNGKGNICNREGVELIIEDCLEYSQECANKDVDVFMINYPYNQSEELHPKVIRVPNWTYIIQKLTDPQAHSKPWRVS